MPIRPQRQSCRAVQPQRIIRSGLHFVGALGESTVFADLPGWFSVCIKDMHHVHLIVAHVEHSIGADSQPGRMSLERGDLPEDLSGGRLHLDQTLAGNGIERVDPGRQGDRVFHREGTCHNAGGGIDFQNLIF